MKAKMKIDMDNAAFGNAPGFELTRILQQLAARVGNYDVLEPGDEFVIMDYNGNRVGKLVIKD